MRKLMLAAVLGLVVLVGGVLPAFAGETASPEVSSLSMKEQMKLLGQE